MSPTGRELQKLLSPHAVDDFLARYWGREPLYIPGAANKFADLEFDLEALERAIRSVGVRDRMRVRYVGEDNRIKPPPSDLARFSIRDGNVTVCADWIDDRFTALGAYCAGIKTAMSHPGEVFMTCYASPDGHGFGTHWDCQASFILQIEGSKRWRYSAAPTVPWPPTVLGDKAVLRQMTERYRWIDVRFPDRRDEQRFIEQRLDPGDVLFLPAGTWHQASALGHSLALTLACVPMSAADFVDDVVRGMLCDSVEWRSSIPPVAMHKTPPDRLPSALRRFFDARLSELRERVMSLRADDLFETWTHHVGAFSTGAATRSSRAAGKIDKGDSFTVSRTFPIRYVTRPAEASLSLYYLDNRIDFRDEVLPLVRMMLRQKSFSAEAAIAVLGPRLRWRDVKEVLQVLIGAGVLRVARESPTLSRRARTIGSASRL